MGMIINPYNFKAPLLLDTYTGAAVAYSLRKLRTAYTGYCIEVRRSSDDTTANIGFVNGVLDESALTTFVGAGDGFVKTWYDQSENGYNLVQTTTTYQPRIVLNGTVVTGYGSKPAIDMYDDALGFAGLSKTYFNFLHKTQATISSVWKNNKDDNSYFFNTTAALSNITTRIGIVCDSAGIAIGNGGGVGYVIKHSVSLIQGHMLFDYDCTQATAADRSKLRINSSDQSDNTSSEAASASASYVDLFVASKLMTSGAFDANWQEFIIWNSRRSSDRTAIEANINSFYSIY